MTQEELQLLQTLLEKAQQVLDFVEDDGISVEFDDELQELVLNGKCCSLGIWRRTVSSQGTADDYI